MNSQTFDRLSKAFAGFCGIYLLAYLFLYIRGSLFYFGEESGPGIKWESSVSLPSSLKGA
jgi:hypothetical protein